MYYFKLYEFASLKNLLEENNPNTFEVELSQFLPKSVSSVKNVPLKSLPLFLNTLFHTPVPLRERTEQEVFSSIPGNGSIMRSVLSDVFVHLVKTYFLQLLFTIFLYLFDDFFFSPQSLCLCKEEISNKHQVCIISNYMNLPV